MAVELLKSRGQPLPHFAVELRDAVTEPCDRLGQLGAFAAQFGNPRFELGGLAFSHQIDGAHAVSLAGQALQPDLRLGWTHRRFLLGNPRELTERFGRDTNPFADLAYEASQAFSRAVSQPFEPREVFASLGQHLVGRARRIDSLAQLPLADGERISRPAAGGR